MAHARGCHHKERRYNWLIRRGFDWCTWFESSGCGGQWQFVCHSTWSILFDVLSLFFLSVRGPVCMYICIYIYHIIYTYNSYNIYIIYNVRVHDHHDAPKQLILQMLWHGVTTRWNYKPNNSHSAWALGSVHPYIRRFAHSRGPQGPRSGGRSIRSWENWGHGILLIFPFMFSGVTMITVIIEYNWIHIPVDAADASWSSTCFL